MAEEEEEGAAMQQHSASEECESEAESSSSSTFSFPSAAAMAPFADAASVFMFDPDQGAEAAAESSILQEVSEVDSCEYKSAASASCSSIPEVAESDCISQAGGEIEEELESGSECVQESGSDVADRGSGATDHSVSDKISVPVPSKPSKDDGSSSEGESRRCHGFLRQLIGSDEVDRHCDVLDVFRKGIHNWRMVARMSGWLACRGCCYKPVNCCHHSTGSPKAVEGHSRKESQDTNAVAAAASAACCTRKSSPLSPLKSATANPPLKSSANPPLKSSANPPLKSSFGNGGHHVRRESPQQVTNVATTGPACSSSSSNARKSGVTPLRSSKLSSAEELSVHVPPGMIGLAWLETEPLLLTSKSYTFPSSASFSLQELALESTRVIHHGFLHRVSIPEGKLGVAWVDGQAKVLEPGVHVLNCALFAYTTADDRDASHKEVALGPFRVITVKEDEVGVKYCNRKPHLLYAGRCLQASDRYLAGGSVCGIRVAQDQEDDGF